MRVCIREDKGQLPEQSCGEETRFGADANRPQGSRERVSNACAAGASSPPVEVSVALSFWHCEGVETWPEGKPCLLQTQFHMGLTLMFCWSGTVIKVGDFLK